MRGIMKLTIKVMFNIGFIYIFVSSASAKCSKEDIDYYLEKGFTTEQVSAMCSEEIISSKDLTS